MSLETVQGVRRSYNFKEIDLKELGTYVTYGDLNEAVMEFDLTDFPGPDSTLDVQGHIPAGSIIKSGTVEVLEAATSGGTPALDIGLQEKDGTEIDNDGLVAAAALAALELGDRIVMAGALIGTAIAPNGYIVAASTGVPFTAGRVRITVQYAPPRGVPVA